MIKQGVKKPSAGFSGDSMAVDDAPSPVRGCLLDIGHLYRNTNGGVYRCEAMPSPGVYTMRRIKDGWTLDAHMITGYPDGRIAWDYSTGGHWLDDMPGRN